MNDISTLNFCIDESKEGVKEFKYSFIQRYKKVCKSIYWDNYMAFVEIDTSKPEYEEIKQKIKELKRHISEQHEFEYTKEELNTAEYLKVTITCECTDSPSENNPGLFYDEYVPGSEIYTKQKCDLRIRKGSLGKKDIILSYEWERIVSLRLKKVLESAELRGINLRPVYCKSEVDPIAYQIIATNILPKFSLGTKIYEDMDKKQKKYNFKCYNYDWDTLFYYDKTDKAKFKDFSYSVEYFGSGFYPSRFLIVSQKVRQIFLAEKVRNIEYTPIFFE